MVELYDARKREGIWRGAVTVMTNKPGFPAYRMPVDVEDDLSCLQAP